MTVRLLAFAGLRDVLGGPKRELSVADGATLADLWAELVRARPQFGPLEGSTRFALNGRLVARDATLAEGDEVALMPTFGGG